MKQCAKVLWLSLSIAVLIIALVKFDGTPNSDVDEFQGLAMLLLSFPVGYVVVLLLSLFGIIIEKLFSVAIKTNYLELVLTWAVFVIAGYVQWFKVLPRVLGRWQKRSPGR